MGFAGGGSAPPWAGNKPWWLEGRPCQGSSGKAFRASKTVDGPRAGQGQAGPDQVRPVQRGQGGIGTEMKIRWAGGV